MPDVLAQLHDLISGLGDKDRTDLDALVAAELKRPWLPNPGPQSDAFWSKADVVLYGGAAGGGKTDLIVGLALEHQRTVIFRRIFGELSDIAERLLTVIGSRDGYSASPQPRYRKDGRLVEFGALEKPGSHLAWRGRAHDLICFDEGAELEKEKVEFVIGWLRSIDPAQRCRILIASNPPTGGEGEWLVRWFAPWLDPLYPDPAEPGELRWAFERQGETIWADGPGETTFDGESDPYSHLSRTFIPARLDDNPYLRGTNYRSRLQSLPEPLRSQLLKGDFLAGREDHAWQVIPSAWVDAAQDRWRTAPPKRRRMIALSGDIAGGGNDNSALAALHEDAWFAPVAVKRTADIKDVAVIQAELAAWMVQQQRDGADLSIDGTGGWGPGVRSYLITNHEMECASLVYSAKSERRTSDGKLGFKNLRADMYWGLREALDPESGDDVMLPPDPRLKAQLTAPRYSIVGTEIKVEGKDEIKARLGSSPDEADAVVQVWRRRRIALKPKTRAMPSMAPRGGWMSR